MRILHVISGLGVGGAERNMARLVRHSIERGHDCWVLSATGTGPIAGELGDAPMLACELDLGVLRGWRRARAFADGLRPDVIHGWMYHGNLLAALLARRARAPLLWDVRHSIAELSDEKLTTRWIIRASGWPMWRPDLVVFNSEAGQRSHQALGYERWTSAVIRNGVDVERYAGRERQSARERLRIASDAPVIAWVARHHPIKDLETFAAAARRVSEQRPGARFVFAGRGMTAANDEVARCLAAHALSEPLLLGERDDLASLYAGFDLVLSSSRGEGTSNVLLEAMAAGVPCVSTDVGDARILIGDDRFVAPVGDAAALAAAALTVLDLDPASLEALRARNRERVAREHSIDGWVVAYLDAYQRVTSGR